jgi:peptide/nickel transport system substrate-binding protein
LLLAIDRQTVAQKVYFGLAEVANNIEPKISWGYSDQVPPYPYDAQKAASLLDGAGWKAGADGVRTKNGIRFSIELLTLSGVGPFLDTGQVMVEAWKKVGVEAALRPIQNTEFFDRWDSGDFDVLLINSNTQPDPDRSVLFDSIYIGQGGDPMRYRSPQADSLFDQALRTVDRTQRKVVLAQLQKLLMDDLPMAPVVWPKTLVGVSKRVRNMKLGAYTLFTSYWFKDVWVSDGK